VEAGGDDEGGALFSAGVAPEVTTAFLAALSVLGGGAGVPVVAPPGVATTLMGDAFELGGVD
jgi:hypothetical protein